MAQHPRLDFQVAYCSLRGAEAGFDPEFGATVKWDVPLLDGYTWTSVPNRGAGDESFWGLRNPGLWGLIRGRKFDAVISHVGYRYSSFWIAYLAARSCRTPFIFGTDASSIEPRDGSRWKVAVKRIAWPMIFRMSAQVLTASTAGYDMMRSLGFPEKRISMTLDTVDNEWWLAQAQAADREAVRATLGVGPREKVILFCAKLQPWKRPRDVLQAFDAAGLAESVLIYAGDGALRRELEAEGLSLGIGERVRFLGFVNQTQLPGLYKAADLMVIPSEYEPFGLVVNEAMLCGCPVVASDRVGAVRDLIGNDACGFVYPCGDVQALAKLLRRVLSDPAQLISVRASALERIKSWSPRESAEALVEAVERAVAAKRSA
jgi:glycosyltransferase involved in cell wall biosynthesis